MAHDTLPHSSLIEMISPRGAACLAHPDLGVRLLGGAIWMAMGFAYAAAILTAILTAPTAVCWLIQQGWQLVERLL